MTSPMRMAVARHMTYSKQNIPHYYLTMRAVMDAALARRTAWNAGRVKEEQLTVNHLIIRAAVLALQANSRFNGFYKNGEFQPQQRINIGIAIDLPDGLIAPAILDCQTLSLEEIATQSRDLAARAKQGTLRAEEYTAATFTITNLGMFGVESFSAIIVPPQVAILAVGAAKPAPILRDGALAVEQQMLLTLSGDHRATDGAEGARFLGEIIKALEDPEGLFG